MAKRGSPFTWQDLEGKIVSSVLHAPKTGGDPNGNWTTVHDRLVRYLARNVVGTLWADSLALITAVLCARRLDVASVDHVLHALHPRFSALFPALGLETMEQWKIEQHLTRYVQGEIVANDSENTRQDFLRCYMSATNQVWNWLDSLPPDEKAAYQHLALPTVNPLLHELLNKRKEIEEQQQKQRKDETEAVVPQFAALRAEAHYRYNRVSRLHHAYQQALIQVLPDRSNLPFELCYEEGNPPVERLHFKLWDRRSFTLSPEHCYSDAACSKARHKKHAFTDEHNDLFIEFVKTERLDDAALPEGLWFTEILFLGLFGTRARCGDAHDVETKQDWLHQWGYGRSNHFRTSPFEGDAPGLLNWGNEKSRGHAGMGDYISKAQPRTKGTLIPVESLYAATTFGLLALDLLTTTGMRINELMQVNVLPECLIQFVDDPHPGSRDQSLRIRYALRLLPKGERTEKRYNYGVGKESVRLIEKTLQMLSEHYHLQSGEPLPRVLFDPTHHRSHRFEQESVPYLLQYNFQHLTDNDISACIRFLMHGMVFQTSAGVPVVLKPHLLRHAFATYAVQYVSANSSWSISKSPLLAM